MTKKRCSDKVAILCCSERSMRLVWQLRLREWMKDGGEAGEGNREEDVNQQNRQGSHQEKFRKRWATFSAFLLHLARSQKFSFALKFWLNFQGGLTILLFALHCPAFRKPLIMDSWPLTTQPA